MFQPNKAHRVGEYTHYSFCRFCGSTKIRPVIDLGLMPLAGGFMRDTAACQREKVYPLILCFCPECYLLQTADVIAADTLFKQYFYESAAIGTLVTYFASVAQTIKKQIKDTDPLIVEIGSNDGTFISEVKKLGLRAVGVDPAENIVLKAQKQNLPIELGYFTEEMAQKISAKYGKAAAIYSFNTLAHIEDMHAVLRGITTLLQPDGYLQFEIHYLGSVIDTTQYDMIYHEHQYYYSLLTLQKFFKQYQMEIFSVKKTTTHAGSLSVRVQFATTGTRRVDRSVATVLKEEKEKKYDAIATYRQVQTRIKQNRRSLLQLVKKLKQQGKHIVGYGASGRGTIISNYCHLDSRYLDYIIDDAPAKATVFTPGVQLHVYPSSILAQEHPDYILLFAWAFFDEIKQRIQKQCPQHKPTFILPLPQVKLTR